MFGMIMAFSILIPLVVVVLIVLSVVTKVKNFTKTNLGMTPTQTMNLISDGIKQEVTTPKAITSLSSVYAPKIERDFPQVGFNGMDALVRNALVGTLNAIESENTSSLRGLNCSEAFINKVQNIIVDLRSKNEDDRYDNIVIHKSGIASYLNRSEQAVATFEVAVQYNYTKTKNGQIISNGLIQAAYEVLLTYNQVGHETSTDMVYTSTCPNCGAPIKVNGKNKMCEYCGSGFTEIADRVWQVTDFNLIK